MEKLNQCQSINAKKFEEGAPVVSTEVFGHAVTVAECPEQKSSKSRTLRVSFVWNQVTEGSVPLKLLLEGTKGKLDKYAALTGAHLSEMGLKSTIEIKNEINEGCTGTCEDNDIACETSCQALNFLKEVRTVDGDSSETVNIGVEGDDTLKLAGEKKMAKGKAMFLVSNLRRAIFFRTEF